ncbi:MAG TPA: hypothetical protein VIU37_10270, partial [Candidatus Limnocylindrales bacterium]
MKPKRRAMTATVRPAAGKRASLPRERPRADGARPAALGTTKIRPAVQSGARGASPVVEIAPSQVDLRVDLGRGLVL